MTPLDDIDRTVIDSTGNVYADLGLPTTEEEMLKVGIAAAITNILQDRGLTQTEAAKLIGETQPNVSRLLRGRLKGFSVSRLLFFLVVLGFNVDIRIRKEPKKDRGKITVAA